MLLNEKTEAVFREQRQFKRKKVRVGSTAVMADSEAKFDCTIVDVSPSGARLEIKETDIVPGRFKMYVPDADYIHDCEVVWRNANQLGVRFAKVVMF